MYKTEQGSSVEAEELKRKLLDSDPKLARLDAVIGSLLENGCPPDTPAAVVSRATWPNQDVRWGTARNIHRKAMEVTSPALVVLGNVVALSEDFLKTIVADYADASA